MRSAVIIAAIAGLATSSPVVSRDAQNGIDLDVFDDAPKISHVGPAVGALTEKPTYNLTKAAAAARKDATDDLVAFDKRDLDIEKRDACASQPDGYGPVSSPDTYNKFTSDSQFSDIANNAQTPQGYSLSFSDLDGSVEGPGYMGLYTLKTFDTVRCQQECDKAPACYGFNVFMERNPKYDPAASCPDPESITNYKCTLWGANVTPQSATNKGQWRNQFHVGIRGSNGYSKLAAPPASNGFNGPFAMGGATQSPRGYIGSKFFPGPYDPGQCTAACQATTQYDHDHPRTDGTYDPCNMVNAYVLSQDNVPEGTYCGMYTSNWEKRYSTNYGQWRGQSYFSASQSYTYVLAPQDSGAL